MSEVNIFEELAKQLDQDTTNLSKSIDEMKKQQESMMQKRQDIITQYDSMKKTYDTLDEPGKKKLDTQMQGYQKDISTLEKDLGSISAQYLQTVGEVNYATKFKDMISKAIGTYKGKPAAAPAATPEPAKPKASSRKTKTGLKLPDGYDQWHDYMKADYLGDLLIKVKKYCTRFAKSLGDSPELNDTAKLYGYVDSLDEMTKEAYYAHLDLRDNALAELSKLGTEHTADQLARVQKKKSLLDRIRRIPDAVYKSMYKLFSKPNAS